MTESTVERLTRGYDNFNTGRWEQAIADFHPEFTASDREEIPDPQQFQTAADAFAKAGEGFEEYRLDPVEFEVISNDAVVVSLTQSGRGATSGATVEGTVVHLWQLRDGLIHSLRAFSTKEQAMEAARGG